jgi:ABC-type uncharacterized transport system substrate-binding protein
MAASGISSGLTDRSINYWIDGQPLHVEVACNYNFLAVKLEQSKRNKMLRQPNGQRPLAPIFRRRLGKISTRLLLRIATISIACLCVTPLAAEQPRTVLVLDQSTPFTEYFGKLFASFQLTLKAGSDLPITIDLERLGQLKGAEYDRVLHTFIREKYGSRPIGVIVANGVDALHFAVNLRNDLDPGIPIVFSGVDYDSAAQLSLPPNITGTSTRRTIRQVLIVANALVSGFKRIVVVGDPLEEQTYRRHYKKELLAIGEEVEFVDLTGLPMNELRKRVAMLPQDAAIFYTTMSSGSSGARYDPNDALALIAEVANRPIVIDQETRHGYGGTGGFVLQAAPIGETTARIVLRLFNGESASSIPVTVGEFVKPVFDWRELKRWNVPESSLPPGAKSASEKPAHGNSIVNTSSLSVLRLCCRPR